MALRFNPPPNWPAPPEGFEPPAGWQPDPAWGPAPEGWQIWVDDSAASSGSAASAAGAAAEADPAWAPTQAVSTAPTASLNTNAPVADPTGMSASAPFGDYAGQPAAVGASPYAANMDYAQSPTPFQNQGAAGGIQPPANGWQPTDTAAPAGPGNGSKPLTQQWWFWTGIAAVVVVALVIGTVFMFKGDSGNGDNKADSTSSSESKENKGSSAKQKAKEPGDNSSSKPSDDSTGKSDGPGSSAANPIDPTSKSVEFKADEYATDPDATVTVTMGAVEWNVNDDLKSTMRGAYKEPPAGKVYIRVPVEVAYKGKGEYRSSDLQITYSHDGNTAKSEYIGTDDMFEQQSMPRDGGTAKGNFVFLVDASTANDGKGVFAVKGFYMSDQEVYFAAK